MKQGFYIKFNKYLKCEWLSVILATMAYWLYCCMFMIKKLTTSKKVVDMDYKTALNNLEEFHPCPKYEMEFNNKPISEAVDLSIIIPVYNYEKVLEGTVKSILNQKTKYNYEVIFVDDGSTDGAQDILRKYENEKNVTVIFQKNKGIGGARNTGIDASVGKYLMFVDCDDTLHDDIVEVLMSKAYETNDDIVICGHNLVKENEGKILDVTPQIYPIYNLMGYNDGDYIMNYPGLPWAKVYKRKLFDNVRYFTGFWYEDTITHMLLFRLADSFSYIQKALYDYRWYEGNYSITQMKSCERSAERYWLLLENIKHSEKIGLPCDKVFYKTILRHLASFYYYSIYGLDDKIIESMFILGCELVEKYRPKNESYKLPLALKNVEKAFLTRDVNLWKISSQYI